MMNTSRLQIGLAALLLASFALPSPARATNASATGSIVSLSAATRTVTIQNNDGSQVILRAGDRSALARNGAPVKFAALALRDKVTVQFQRSSSAIARLDARGPALSNARGIFAAFNSTSGVLTMASLQGARSFKVGASTLVVRNGAATTAQGLARGDALLVHAQPAAAGAVALAADIAADGPEEEDVEGTISTIAGQDVTITPEHGSAVTVHVGTSTVITLIDASGKHTATLADLSTGMRAEADYDPVSLVADHIRARAAEQAHVRGKVTAVDATANTISITPNQGAAIALKTDASTRISLNGAPATLADIVVGVFAIASYDGTTMLASRIEARSADPAATKEIEGKVTAVTATGLTIAGEHGTSVTLIVDATTKIFIAGSAATLADIKVGDQAEARYDGTTLVASVIRARHQNPHPFRQVEGLVSAISATGFTVTPEHGSPITLTVDANTKIFKGGTPGTLADIVVGARAHAAYDGTTMVAAVVRLQGPVRPQLSEIRGSVTAASASSVTITPQQGSAVTLAIDSTTVITVDHHSATAADIHVGDSAEAHYDAATMLAKLIEVRHSGGHH